MMATIALINQKGGVGKSTAAVHLAWWLSNKKRQSVLLVDTDVQRSSSKWLANMGDQIPYSVMSDENQILDQLPGFREEYTHIIVDGQAGLSGATRAVLLRSDLAICPVQASALDLDSAKEATYLIRQAQSVRDGKPVAAIFLSRAVKGTRLATEAYSYIENVGIPALKTIIYQRQAIADAPGQGATVFEMTGSPAAIAAKDFTALFKEIMGILK